LPAIDPQFFNAGLAIGERVSVSRRAGGAVRRHEEARRERTKRGLFFYGVPAVIAAWNLPCDLQELFKSAWEAANHAPNWPDEPNKRLDRARKAFVDALMELGLIHASGVSA
jgi:hypothetical protein